MKHQIKRFVFKLYAPISVAVFFAAILLLRNGLLNWNELAAIAAGVFAFAFGVQKQNLEETKLFKELFEQFNERYDDMNDNLNQIHEQPSNSPLNKDEKRELFKYFNLCGEEYLYYDKGFICKKVWTAWKTGMEFFRGNKRIKNLWDEELKNNKSYYGLTFQENITIKLFRRILSFVLMLPMVPLSGEAQAPNQLGYNFEFLHSPGLYKANKASETNDWYKRSFEHCKSQAEMGDTVDQFCLASIFYDTGDGVPQNWVEAAKWYRKAAEKNYAPAQYMLGCDYLSGCGVPKDYVQAYKWVNLSSSQGYADSKEVLSFLEHRMTPEQIAEAQQLSREFAPPKEARGSSSDNPASAESPTASGTGFFITEDGYLISNYHVVKDAAKVRLLTSAGTLDAKVMQVDAANDLALLKAEGKFSALPVAASRAVSLGNTVATVGFPNITLQGFAPKLAKGEIAALSGAGDDARYFQISVPVQPGNSGGALVDDHGNVVGIVSAKLDVATALAASGSLPENVNYAVKSSFLLSFLESVPDVAKKMKEPNTKDEKFEDVVKSAEAAAVLVLVY